ncbi:MAG: hypothetical protein PUG71_05545, partial [bacterium]|nr:hypothetical protein [bacterium]
RTACVSKDKKYVEPCVETSILSLGWKKQVSKDKIWDLLCRELRELSLWGTDWSSRDKKYVELGVEASKLSLGWKKQVSKDKIWDFLGRELRELSLGRTAWASRDKKRPAH